MKKRIVLVIFLIVLIAGTLFYFNISRRTLHITGYALKGDTIIVKINGNAYTVGNYRNTNKSTLNYLYEEIQYNSLKHDDFIQIKIDSNKFKLLDTSIILNKANTYPRIFFEEPYSSENARRASLINDSNLLHY